MATLVTILLGLLASEASAAGHLFPDCTNGPLKSNGVCNTSLSVTDRAKALVAALQTEEKFQLVNDDSPGVPRLGLPSYEWWSEALHGVASSPGVSFESKGNWSSATSFPQPILMGAAFDDQLIEDVASIVSTEARAFNNFNHSGLDYWTPNINPYRDPRWGRGQETPGEDPFHIQSYIKALVKGLQTGDDPDHLKVVATCKHFAGYDMENWMGYERYAFDAQIPPQELSEYFMQPFKTCARDAKVASIMCSYNALNGVPTCANNYILQDLLRNHWNWTDDGFYVTSDCDAIQNVFEPHDYTATREEAVADALKAGTDLNCGQYYGMHLPAAFEQGLIQQTDIDNALIRLYSAQVRLGVFDPASASVYRSYTWANVNTPAAQQLALKAAEEGIVLLKNDGTLPINIPDDKTTNIALLGSWANASTDMQGNYAGVAPFLVTPLQAASNLPHVNASYSAGDNDPLTDVWPLDLELAEAADYILWIDGYSGSESDDRDLIRWSGEHRDIMTQLAGLGKPFIIIQMGDQVDDAPFLQNENVSAILWTGYPGQSGGDAIFNILTGKTAPAGRLPVTQYPEDYVFIVPMNDMGMRPNATSGNPGRTYQWYDNATIPFGYGLHYTNFTTSIKGTKGDSFDVKSLTNGCNTTYLDQCPFSDSPVIAVENTGKVASDFVVLGFVAGQHGPTPYPLKKLAAYDRVSDVQPGAVVDVPLNLTLGSLGRQDQNGNLVLYPGDYSVLIDVPTQVYYNFTLTGQQLTLEEWPQDTGK